MNMERSTPWIRAAHNVEVTQTVAGVLPLQVLKGRHWCRKVETEQYTGKVPRGSTNATSKSNNILTEPQTFHASLVSNPFIRARTPPNAHLSGLHTPCPLTRPTINSPSDQEPTGRLICTLLSSPALTIPTSLSHRTPKTLTSSP